MSVQTDRLANGFRIVSEHMPGLQSAAVGVWVTAGGRNERIEQNGIAHFLEHMAFKGTRTRSALQIAEAIEDVGGYINAYTSREVTAYYARVLEADVPLAVDVIADILLNPAFDPAEIEVERGVILQEIGLALDTPDDVIFDWLQEESYRGQALGRTILGPSERVSAFNQDDLRAFIGEHYGPGEMILSACGAVDHDAIVKAAETMFGHLTPKAARDVPLATFTGGEFRRDKALEQAHFALAFDFLLTFRFRRRRLGGLRALAGLHNAALQRLHESITPPPAVTGRRASGGRPAFLRSIISMSASS